MDMHWGAKEAARELLEKGDEAMSPKEWWRLAELRKAAIERERKEKLREALRYVNGGLATYPPVDGVDEFKIDLAGSGLSMATDGNVRSMLVEEYKKAGWRRVHIKANVLIMFGPVEEE